VLLLSLPRRREAVAGVDELDGDRHQVALDAAPILGSTASTT
jgi:hypothetical protein